MVELLALTDLVRCLHAVSLRVHNPNSYEPKVMHLLQMRDVDTHRFGATAKLYALGKTYERLYGRCRLVTYIPGDPFLQ